MLLIYALLALPDTGSKSSQREGLPSEDHACSRSISSPLTDPPRWKAGPYGLRTSASCSGDATANLGGLSLANSKPWCSSVAQGRLCQRDVPSIEEVACLDDVFEVDSTFGALKAPGAAADRDGMLAATVDL
jgi:hypothetical protein